MQPTGVPVSGYPATVIRPATTAYGGPAAAPQTVVTRPATTVMPPVAQTGSVPVVRRVVVGTPGVPMQGVPMYTSTPQAPQQRVVYASAGTPQGSVVRMAPQVVTAAPGTQPLTGSVARMAPQVVTAAPQFVTQAPTTRMYAPAVPGYAPAAQTRYVGASATSVRYVQAAGALPGPADELKDANSAIWDDGAMKATLPAAVYLRFKDALVTGAATSEEDMKVIAAALFKWARALGAVSFAHWFFPMRGGSGAVGGAVGALKMDTLIDLDWSSKLATKPFGATLPYERLFFGETDGSSFPNGELRATHTAAAFTTWDRSSPCFLHDRVLRVPCSFVTHLGDCIDDKTPLLRSCDAVNRQGLRLLKALKMCTNAKQVISYLGWEQEFFVIPAKFYRARPDLMNCGRTLIGKLPTRNQQGDLNYFAPVPGSVTELMSNIQVVMLKLGIPMAVMHNEVAPAQHEMSPIYCQATFSCDNNVLFMEVANAEAAKLGLAVLFHEKPFQGINGSGKHNNWSVGTDTGLNLFYPGKTPEARTLYATGIACLTYGLAQYNEMVRCSVSGAGNDFRLGAQEAPPAIISLYPGTGFEKHVDAVIAGADLGDYMAEKSSANPGATSAMAAPCGVEDRNRTAPFPFCGNRFEFRAVGSSQNCSFPITVCNTIMAAGMAALAAKVEGGVSHRDAVAQMFQENRHVIFTGNGYSAEWPIEAKKRGLPNLNTTPLAVAEFATAKNKQVFEEQGIFSAQECEARQAVMWENYNTTVKIEADTLIHMIETGIIPACANDYTKFVEQGLMDFLGDDRSDTYKGVKRESDKLKAILAKVPHGDAAKEAEYFCNTVKPQMVAVRDVVDKAEGLMEQGLYPYPTYEQMLYEHHS